MPYDFEVLNEIFEELERWEIVLQDVDRDLLLGTSQESQAKPPKKKLG